jgi:hypothetical protein
MNACNANIKIINVLDSLGNVMQAWNTDWTNLMLTTPKSLETLSLMVAYLATLLNACPKHAPTNGVSKFNTSHEIIDNKAMVVVSKLVPSSLT